MCHRFTRRLAMLCVGYGLAGQAGVRAAEPASSAAAAPTEILSAAPTPKTAESGQLELRLLGIVAADETGLAICFNPATGEAIRLRMGENFEGWVLRSVHGHKAAFEKASQRTVLELTSRDEGQTGPLPPQQTGAVATPQPQGLVPPIQPVRAGMQTWMDGDGQMIAPPRK